jgi:RNA recognition motif-containing protein
MGKKLYVGNLSFQTTGSGLEQLFSQYGAVSQAEVVQDRDTGRSRGFAFVEMSSDNEAAEAVRSLHDQEFEGRRLVVNEAQAKPQRTGGGGGGPRRGRY